MKKSAEIIKKGGIGILPTDTLLVEIKNGEINAIRWSIKFNKN